MVVTSSRLFLTNSLPSTVHVCEINLFFFSWQALYARVLRVLVKSSLMLTCAKCSPSFRTLLALIILRFVVLSRRRTIICLGFGGPFPGLYYLITRWERIISPSGRSLSTDFTMFLTMSVALLSLRSNGPTDPLHISCICSIWKILHFYSSFSLNLSTSGFFHWVDTFSSTCCLLFRNSAHAQDGFT
jgi:hypothetical protein